jgi:hypothetical protein
MSRFPVAPRLVPFALGLLLAAVPANAQFETRGRSVAEFEPYSIAVGDFNHDGNLDMTVAATGLTGGPSIAVLLGKGDGSFLPTVGYNAGVGPTSIVAADFNHDGNLDLAVANSLSDYVSVFLGNGDGTFTPGPQNPTTLAPQAVVAVGDFNGDGIPDLIALSRSNPCKCISVFLGNGDGTFQDAIITEPSFDVESIGIGDFNRDGKLDVVTAGNFTVNVLLGNGDGTFKYGASFPSPESPESIAVADFNNDHKLDLAIANSEGGSVSVLIGNGNGTFQPAVDYPIAFATWVAAADLTGNHKLDLIVANDVIEGFHTYSGATVFRGNGDGTFQQPGSFYESDPVSDTSYVAVGDFNNDRKPDIAITDFGYNDIVVMLNTGVVSFTPSTMLLFNQQAVSTTSPPQKVTLTNTRSAALKVASIEAAGQFEMKTTCGKAIAVGEDCTVSVTFSPRTKGKLNGTVTLIDNASSKPQVIAMQGTGTD